MPIWQATHAEVRRPVDPFRATRVVLFAKASAYVGAALLGVGAGFEGVEALVGDDVVLEAAGETLVFLDTELAQIDAGMIELA